MFSEIEASSSCQPLAWARERRSASICSSDWLRVSIVKNLTNTIAAIHKTAYPMNNEPVPKKFNNGGNVNETTAFAAQLTTAPNELPKPRMFNGNDSPIITHITGPQVAEKKAM